MTTISHREMRNNSAEVLRHVEAGEEYVVTNNGRAVARITPIRRSVIEELTANGEIRPARHGIDEMIDFARPKLDASSAEILRDARGEW